MTLKETRQAKVLHALWDMIIMHHSVESVLDTYHIRLIDIAMVISEVERKCNEYKPITRKTS